MAKVKAGEFILDIQGEATPDKVQSALNDARKFRKAQILEQRDRAVSTDNLATAGSDILSGQIASQSGGQALLEGLLREEAGAAQPALNIIRSLRPTLGEKPTAGVAEGFLEGVKGDTFSKFKQFEQAQLGDIFREFNVPEPLAAAGGLAFSGLLPSSLAGGAAIRAGAKGAKAATTTLGKFVFGSSKKVSRTPVKEVSSPIAKDLINTFRNLDKGAKLGRILSTETIEALTNIKSDEIIFALDNPNILTRANARPEKIKDVADVATEAIRSLRKSGNTVLTPSDRMPLEIAENISSSFNTAIDDAGKAVGREKSLAISRLKQEAKATGKIRGINSGQFSGQINILMDKFGFLDATGKVKPAFKGSKAVAALNDVKKVIKETANVPGEVGLDPLTLVKKTAQTRSLEIGDLFDIKKSIQDIAFKHSSLGDGGIVKPAPEVENALRKVNGIINNTVKTEYADFPGLQDSFKKFSTLAEVRTDIRAGLRDPNKLAKFLRRFDRANPEDLEELSELISVLPNKTDATNQIKQFVSMKENSIAGRLGLRNLDSKTEVQSTLEGLFAKPIAGEGAISTPKQEAIIMLERASGKKIARPLFEHQVAKSFSQKSNFFRALAAGGILGIPGIASGNPLAGVAGFAGGLALTDPRIQGGFIKSSGAFGRSRLANFIGSAGKVAKPAVGPSIRGSGRVAIQDFLEERSGN